VILLWCLGHRRVDLKSRYILDVHGLGLMREEVTRAARRRIGSPSEFENHITRELETFGFGGFEREVSPFEGPEGGELLKIDIAWVDKKVALELDGPSHFLKSSKTGKEGRRNGPTEAKKRLLKSLGWKVRRLDWKIDRKLQKMNEKERRAFWEKSFGNLLGKGSS
jgi:hypothetical protein